MSSCKATSADRPLTTAGRIIVRLVGAGVIALMLAGCEGGGFRPLYATVGSGANTEAKLKQIEVGPLPNRNGQRLRNELVYQFSGGDAVSAPVYRLEVQMSEQGLTTLVVKDGTSTAAIWQAVVSFQLVRLEDKKIILSGSSVGRATYEKLASTFSNVRGMDDAAERATKSVANDIRGRLAAFLSSNG